MQMVWYKQLNSQLNISILIRFNAFQEDGHLSRAEFHTGIAEIAEHIEKK